MCQNPNIRTALKLSSLLYAEFVAQIGAWIEKSWKGKAKPLVLEEIGTKDLLEFAECCYVFDDILVVQNYVNSDRHLLEFVDMNTMKIQRQALMIGNGPGEVINAIIINSA